MPTADGGSSGGGPSSLIVKIACTLSFLVSATAIVLLQQRKSQEVKRQIKRKKKEESTVNIGAIFGMDVGGTLAKIVYFESTQDLKVSTDDGSTVESTFKKQAGKTPQMTGTSTGIGFRSSSRDGEWGSVVGPLVKVGAIPPKLEMVRRSSSESLAQLDKPDHKDALKKFYHFMEENRGVGASSGVFRDLHLIVESDFLEGRLHFLHFETRNMVSAIQFVSDAALIDDIRTIGCTGGGAHKYAKEFEEQLGITFNKFDELQCLIRGMHFALTNFKDECFTYRPVQSIGKKLSTSAAATTAVTAAATASAAATATAAAAGVAAGVVAGAVTGAAAALVNTVRQDTWQLDHVPQEITDEDEESMKKQSEEAMWLRDVKEYTDKVVLPLGDTLSLSQFPYLVVNIGSGVSILKVTAPGEASRISGTSIGGGTYWGLCRLLTRCGTYEEVLDLAESGDAGMVDMLVKDIYGGDYGEMLRGSMVASSFGKLVMKENPQEGVRDEDLALALLMMITNNIGQVAYLNAQLHKCSKIFFVGSFLRHNTISCRRLAFAIQFWSSGKMEAYFLEHEGHFGALGTFLESAFGADVDKVLTAGQFFHQPAEHSSSATATSANIATAAASGGSTSTGADGKQNVNATFSEQQQKQQRQKEKQHGASWTIDDFADRFNNVLGNSGSFFKPNTAATTGDVLRTPDRVTQSKRGRSTSDDHVMIVRERLRAEQQQKELQQQQQQQEQQQQQKQEQLQQSQEETKSVNVAEADLAPEF